MWVAGAHATSDCIEIPSSELKSRFVSPLPEQARLLGRNWLALSIPMRIDGAVFESVRANYRSQDTGSLKFPVAFHASKKENELTGSIWLPSDYEKLELVVSYRANSCIRILSAKFVQHERIG
jgi:hypothetical protein